MLNPKRDFQMGCEGIFANKTTLTKKNKKIRKMWNRPF